MMNIGAMINHLATDHLPDQHRNEDKLSEAAFLHTQEIRRQLKQILNRQAFLRISLYRSLVQSQCGGPIRNLPEHWRESINIA